MDEIEVIGIESTAEIGTVSVSLGLVLTGAAAHNGPPDLSGVVDHFSYPVEFRTYPSAAVVNADGFVVTQSGPGKDIALAHIRYTPGRTVAGLGQGHTIGSSIEIHTTKQRTVDDTVSRVRGDELTWDGKLFRINIAGNVREGPTGAFRWGIYFAKEIDVKPGNEVT